MEWSWFTSDVEEMESVSYIAGANGGNVLPYTFPEKQTFGFDAQQNRASNVEKRGSLDGAEELTQTGR
jgi:hypothetical protein